MLKPTGPPTWKVGSVFFNTTLAPETDSWVQSSTAPPVTEVRLSWNVRSVPISFTTSIPCN